MTLWIGLTLLGLGVLVWLFGNRMWLLGAGAGALLGVGLMQRLFSNADAALWVLVVGGLAVLFGVLGFIGKAFAKIIAMVVGFVIGGGLAMGFVDMLGMTGFIGWILALIAAVIVAVIFARFLDWGLIIFAALLGSMLIVRGGMAAFPTLMAGTVGSLIVLVLTAVGIFYHYRKNKPKAAAQG